MVISTTELAVCAAIWLTVRSPSVEGPEETVRDECPTVLAVPLEEALSEDETLSLLAEEDALSACTPEPLFISTPPAKPALPEARMQRAARIAPIFLVR